AGAKRLAPPPYQNSAAALRDDDGAVGIYAGEDIGLLQRISPAGQGAGLVIIGQEDVREAQGLPDILQQGGSSGGDYDVKSGDHSASPRLAEQFHQVRRPEGGHGEIAADIESAGSIEAGPIDVLDGEIRIGAEAMDVPPVLTPHIQDESARGRPGPAFLHVGRVNAQPLKLPEDEAAEKVIPHFPQHARRIAQSSEVSGGVAGASPRAQEVVIE